jgi:hypothetical protein
VRCLFDHKSINDKCSEVRDRNDATDAWFPKVKVTFSPRDSHLHVNPTFHSSHRITSNRYNMDHDPLIQAAIADLDLQARINYSATAKRWNLERTTLTKRYRGEMSSKQEANSYVRQQLTDTQEKTLIQYINKLSNQGLPLTPQIIKNLVEEIVDTKLGLNWVSRFCKRHKQDILSVYLRIINHERKLTDNSSYFKYFYEQVRIGFVISLSPFCLLFSRFCYLP